LDSSDTTLDNEGQGGAVQSKGTNRQHGRSFIYLSLEDAEKAARTIDGHERRMPIRSFAQGLGHPQPVSRFRHKLAALESYDLVKAEGESVKLTELAVDMLYGPTEQVRTRARAKAFLSYDLFKETFVQCPKNQDHLMSYVDDFARVSLKIVTERSTFLRRFLESAAYAGLLDGEPDPKAKSIRLRPAIAAPNDEESRSIARTRSSEDQWVIVAASEVGSVLDSLNLTAYLDHSDVSQRQSGEVLISITEGRITVEVRRPVRVSIRTENVLADVSEIVKALQSKGLHI
jgi:hypothetical protein